MTITSYKSYYVTGLAYLLAFIILYVDTLIAIIL